MLIAETNGFFKDMIDITIVFDSEYWTNVKILCNHYTEDLKRRIKYVDKMCKRAMRGKNVGSYANFAFEELCITNSLRCIQQCVKDKIKGVNSRLIAYNDWYIINNDPQDSDLNSTGITITIHSIIEASKSIEELDEVRKLLEFKYNLMKVIINRCLIYPKYNSRKYLRLYPRPRRKI